ncbi:aqualysin-1-like isoform X1 [Diadema setosum]|uniref:aqualysin-1-like isoform X1 n=1 Tax=Diadema setosum TaxID=31175 RepID=UPI003B3B18C8
MRAFIALLLLAVASAELAPLLRQEEAIPGKYIIKIKDDYDLDATASSVRISGGRVGAMYRNVLHGFAASLSEKVVELVRGLPAVEYVEEDGVARAMVTWGLDRIDQRNLPLDNRYSKHSSGNGNGVRVYVIDTGVRASHSDFGGRATQAKNFISGESNSDCNGHGTHCAGTVGSDTYGVAPGVTIIGVKVLGCDGTGSWSAIISGIDYVKENARAYDVASMSLGGSASTSVDNAVEGLISKNIYAVVAAGNSNKDASSTSPARVPAAITVGATSSDDSRWYWNNWQGSNYGSCLDIFAPGEDITSTWYTGNYATSTISGTSMATPHVAGALALYGGWNAWNTILNQASSNKLSNIESGSPNKLLYV